jgi:hypothetical protein
LLEDQAESSKRVKDDIVTPLKFKHYRKGFFTGYHDIREAIPELTYLQEWKEVALSELASYLALERKGAVVYNKVQGHLSWLATVVKDLKGYYDIKVGTIIHSIRESRRYDEGGINERIRYLKDVEKDVVLEARSLIRGH